MASRVWRMVGAFALVMVAGALLAPEATARTSRDDRRKRERKPRYVVARAMDTEGEWSINVLEEEQYKDRRKELPKEYSEAVKEWIAAAKEARKNKEKFDQPRPKKPSITRVGKIYSSKEDAEAFQEKYKEYFEKKLEASRKKEPSDAPGLKDDAPKKDRPGKKDDPKKDPPNKDDKKENDF